MRCRKCATLLPGGSAYCPECGTSVAGAPAAGRSAPAEEVYPLLARANLCRIRGQWAAAADLCAEVLRLDPQNASAHSLLGDIYENQGRLEDAIHWYQLALDLAPTSEADASRLARVRELLEARQRRAEWQAVIESRQQPILTTAAVRESVQTIVMLAGAAVFGIILVMAVLTSAAARLPLEDAANAPLASRFHPTRSSSQRTSSERERLALDALAQSARRAVVDDVTIDPGTRTAIIRLVLREQTVRQAMPLHLRSLILQEAYAAAYAVRWTDRDLQEVIVHITGPLPTAGTPQVDKLFVGALPAVQLNVAPAIMAEREQEPESFYRYTWWNPNLGYP